MKIINFALSLSLFFTSESQAAAQIPDFQLAYVRSWCVVVKDGRVNAYSTDERPGGQKPRKILGPALLIVGQTNGMTSFRGSDDDGNKIEILVSNSEYEVDVRSQALGGHTVLAMGEMTPGDCHADYDSLIVTD